MKKILAILTLTLVLTGCNKTEENTDYNVGNDVEIQQTSNSLVNETIGGMMLTIHGEEFNFDEIANLLIDEYSGIAVTINDDFMEITGELPIFGMMIDNGVAITYIDYEKVDTSDGTFEPNPEDMIDLFLIYRETGEETENFILDKSFYDIELVAEVDGEEYYIATYVGLDEISEDYILEAVTQTLTLKDNIIENIFLFDIEKYFEQMYSTTEEAGLPFGDFEGKTLSGKSMSSEIFADYDLTVVNIWATWCEPCVYEIPYLQEVYENLPENVNFITICEDADLEEDLAKTILSNGGATFETVILTDEMRTEIMGRYTAFPTTAFVDSQGNLVGEPITGVPTENPVEAYQAEIEYRLQY